MISSQKNKVFIFFITIPATIFCLSFTLENVDSYHLYKPAVCVDTNLCVYLVGNTAGYDTIKYIERITGPWQPHSINFSVVPSTNYNCRPGAALGPDQSLHIIYRVTGGTYGWPVTTNNIGGYFVSADTLTTNLSESSYNYGIAVDDQNHAHAVCEIYYNGTSYVKYYYPDADSQLTIVSNAGRPTIAVDKNNVVHVAYISPMTGPKIYYTNNSSGSFSAPQLVSDSAGTEPSIAVDTAGCAHICWASGSWDMSARLYYATNKSGSFQTTRIPTTAGYGKDYSQITLSKQNDVAIVFWLYRSSPQSAYVACASKKADDIDFIVDSIGPATTNPSYGAIIWNDRGVAIDRDGYVHFAYYSPSGTIYAKSQTPLGAQEIVMQETKNKKFEFICQRNPVQVPLRISYQLDAPGRAILKLYDISGREVRNFGAAHGTYLVWDGNDAAGNKVSSSVYILRAYLQNGDQRDIETMKLVIID